MGLLSPAKYTVLFQYAGVLNIAPTAKGSSCTICVSPNELNSLVASRIILPQVIAIQKIDCSLLSARDQEVRIRSRLVGQNHNAGGT